MSDLVLMKKDGEEIKVHPLNVEEHKTLGWVPADEIPDPAGEEAEPEEPKAKEKKSKAKE